MHCQDGCPWAYACLYLVCRVRHWLLSVLLALPDRCEQQFSPFYQGFPAALLSPSCNSSKAAASSRHDFPFAHQYRTVQLFCPPALNSVISVLHFSGEAGFWLPLKDISCGGPYFPIEDQCAEHWGTRPTVASVPHYFTLDFLGHLFSTNSQWIAVAIASVFSGRWRL